MIGGKTISLCTFVLNEEKTLSGMIKSVLPIVDEINILIDDRTSDKTEEVARGYTDRIFYAKFVDFADMRNRALRLGTKDYILMLDADERLLEEELCYLEDLVQNPRYDVWYLTRRCYADLEMKKEISTNPPYPDWQCRLLKNLSQLKYIRKVHEMISGTDSKGYSYRPTIRHFSYYFKTEEELRQRHQLYCAIIKQDEDHTY